MRKIYFRDDLFAVVVNESEFSSGYGFFSENSWAIQVGINTYQAGSSCVPHQHLAKNEEELRQLLDQAMEILFLLDGSCEIDLFHDDSLFETVTLIRGDVIVLLKGGHGLKFLERSRIFECKQGPFYSRERDKRMLPHADQ